MSLYILVLIFERFERFERLQDVTPVRHTGRVKNDELTTDTDLTISYHLFLVRNSHENSLCWAR